MDIEALLGALDHSDESMRKRALLAVAKVKEMRAIGHIKRMSGNDDSVEIRFLAKKVLMHLAGGQDTDGASAKPLPPGALDDADPEVRIEALRQIAASGKEAGLTLVLARAAAERDAGVRAALVCAIGTLGRKEHIPVIEPFLAEADARVRANALEALEAIGDPSTYPYFVRHVQDPDNRIRANATRALGKLGRASVNKLCLAMLRSGQSWMVDSGLYLLVQIKSPDSLPAFEQFAGHPAFDIRSKARAGLEALASEGVERAQEILKKLPKETGSAGGLSNIIALAQTGPALSLGPEGLDDPSLEVRVQAVQSIEKAKDKNSIPALLHRIEVETDKKLRATLVKVVGAFKDPGCASILEALLRDPDERVRANAVEALAGYGGQRELRAIVTALKDTDNRVKANACMYLWGKGHPGVRDVLKGLATSPEQVDRLSAVYAIHQIGDQAVGLLSYMVNDPDAEVRQRALDCRKLLGAEDVAASVASSQVLKGRPGTIPGAASGGTSTSGDGSSRRMRTSRKPVQGFFKSLMTEVLMTPKKLNMFMQVRAGLGYIAGTRRELGEAYLRRLEKDKKPPDAPVAGIVGELVRLKEKPTARSRGQRDVKILELGKKLQETRIFLDQEAGPLLERLKNAEADQVKLEDEVEELGPIKLIQAGIVAGLILMLLKYFVVGTAAPP